MILLDTHVAVWLRAGDERLGSETRQMIREAQQQNAVFLSPITAWEVTMLVAKGRLQMLQTPTDWYATFITASGVGEVQLDWRVLIGSVELTDWAHRDLADRMLVATAKLKRLTLTTADQRMLGYCLDQQIPHQNAFR
ncbi:MAG: type II toxin-antitoxin system VapC family toxin [Pseudomonadota bacterium]